MKGGEKRQQSVIIDDTAMQAEVKTEYLQNSFRVRFLKRGGGGARGSQQVDTGGPNLLKTYSNYNRQDYCNTVNITTSHIQNNSRGFFIIHYGMSFNIKGKGSKE